MTQEPLFDARPYKEDAPPTERAVEIMRFHLTEAKRNLEQIISAQKERAS